MPRSRPPRRSRLPGLILFLCGVAVGAAGFYFGCRDVSRQAGGAGEPTREAAGPSPARSRGLRARGRAAPAAAPGPRAAADGRAPDPAPQVDGIRVALVIDDLGRSVDEVETLERLGVPLTYSVLPFEEETPAVVAQLRRHGDEILCHLPMEPVHGENPGPGALRHGMAAGELRAATAAALAAVPGAVGANNHMGSLLSADERSMHEVLGVLADRNLFFLDSRTSPESVGYRVATALGVPSAERQVFLDGDLRPQMIREQFARTLAIARERGAAIAIGHPHPATLAALAEEVPRAKAMGYRFVPVSALLDRPAASAR
jgi:polysaccharide deacetylase 2 family uncharacterized protein YibQ